MPYSSESKIIDASNVDVLYTVIGDDDDDSIETWTILSKTKTNVWCDNSRWATIAWSAEWKENFRLSHSPYPSVFGILFLDVEATC